MRRGDNMKKSLHWRLKSNGHQNTKFILLGKLAPVIFAHLVYDVLYHGLMGLDSTVGIATRSRIIGRGIGSR
jgi:hypothetical protein